MGRNKVKPSDFIGKAQGYIICWMKRDRIIPGKTEDIYEPFLTDEYGSLEKALHAATKRYNQLIRNQSTYSANLCVIIKSTDYEH